MGWLQAGAVMLRESHEGQPRPLASCLGPLCSCVALGEDGDRLAPPSPAFRTKKAGGAASALRTEPAGRRGARNWRSYREGREPQGSHPCGVPVTRVTGAGRQRVTPSSVVGPCSAHPKDGKEPPSIPLEALPTSLMPD